jgi:hypothetical protein
VPVVVVDYEFPFLAQKHTGYSKEATEIYLRTENLIKHTG